MGKENNEERIDIMITAKRAIFVKYYSLQVAIAFVLCICWFLKASTAISYAQNNLMCTSIATEDIIPGIDYERGTVIVTLHDGYESIGEALLGASNNSLTVTGIDSFDSISLESKIIKIVPFPSFSSSFQRVYILKFPEDEDLLPIIEAYNELSYIGCAELNIIYSTSISEDRWGRVKLNLKR